MARLNALVLAGGGRDGVCDGSPAVNKAFVEIAGTPMVTRVIRALRATAEIERIAVVVPPGSLDDPALAGSDQRRPAGAQIVDSLRSGVDGTDPAALLLLSTSDAPLLDARGIEDFIAKVRVRDADLAYAIVEKRAHERRFPGVPHTWARMRDGVYCGGAVFALRPRVVPALGSFLGQLAAARKSPVQLASLFGWDVLLRFMLGFLSIDAAERRASALLGASVAAIPSAAELAFNVDRKSDLALAERYVRAAELTSSA